MMQGLDQDSYMGQLSMGLCLGIAKEEITLNMHAQVHLKVNL